MGILGAEYLLCPVDPFFSENTLQLVRPAHMMEKFKQIMKYLKLFFYIKFLIYRSRGDYL